MRLPSEFKGKKKKYLIHNLSGYNDILGIFELRLNSLKFTLSSGDTVKNFHVVDIRPYVNAKLKKQGEIFLLGCVEDEKLNIASYNFKSWEESDYFKALIRDGKISDVIEDKETDDQPF